MFYINRFLNIVCTYVLLKGLDWNEPRQQQQNGDSGQGWPANCPSLSSALGSPGQVGEDLRPVLRQADEVQRDDAEGRRTRPHRLQGENTQAREKIAKHQ